MVTGTEPAAPLGSTQKDDVYVYIRVPPGESIASGYWVHRDGAEPCFPEHWATKYRTSLSISSGVAASACVAAVARRFQLHFVRACLGLAAWRVWRYERGYRRHRTAFGGTDAACRGASCGPGASAAAEIKLLMDSGSGITASSEELVEALR